MFAQEFPNAIYIGAAPAGNGTGEATTPGVYRKLDSAISVVKPIANRFAIARCDSMRRTACDEIPIGVHRFLIPAEKLPSLYARERERRSQELSDGETAKAGQTLAGKV